MTRLLKIVLVGWLVITAFFTLLVVVDRARALVPTPTSGNMTRHWCHHHRHKCKRALRRAHLRALRVDGSTATASAELPAPTSTTFEGCWSHKMRRQMGGHWGSGDGLLVEWVQHLDFSFCWKGGSITDHYSHAYVDHVLGWVIRHNGDRLSSEWYPWGHRFSPAHNGRFEGIDSTMQACPGLVGLSCLIEDHPWIHAHLHGDGSWSYNSGKV